MGEKSRLVGKLPNHLDVKNELPLSEQGEEVVTNSKLETMDILSGKSDKKILIVGPCSADFNDSLEEYAQFISEMREKYSDKIEIIMRFYTGKPRTIGGWKGLSHSRPGDEPDIARGLLDSREIAINLIEKYKIPLADEMLHPQLINTFSDLYSYLAVGARSTENQGHREVASGLNIPIGFKNPQSGDIDIMTNSIKAGQSPSTYTILDNIYDSIGNEYSHAILRGGRINGNNFSNYHEDNLIETLSLFEKKGIINPSIIVDTNHENSNKQYEKQIEIMINVLDTAKNLKQMGYNSEHIKGFMVESYLLDGRQDWPKDNDITKLKKGCSLTDPCLGIEKTRIFIEEMYKKI